MLHRISLIALMIFLSLPVRVFGQIIPPNTGESEEPEIRIGTRYTILPIAGYSSDMGLLGGILLQRINYGYNIRPFLSNLSTDFTISTKGNMIADLKYERTRTLGKDVRSLIEFTGQRFRQAHYFGIGNQTEFSEDLFENEYYFFENREFSIYYQARKSVLRFGQFGQLDLTASADFSYLNGIRMGEQTKYAEDTPFGFEKSWANKVGIGFIADNRDNEFVPLRGFRYEASFESSLPLVGSEYTYSEIRMDVRHYLTLFGNVVLAQKLNIESIHGEAPFWDLAIIGGEYGLRGFHLDRFRGDHSVSNLLELRSWLFSFWNDDIRIGNQIFWDTGRVFSRYDSDEVFNNWKHSFGGGLVFSFFNPDLILRMEAGFSNETYRLHFGAGYVF